MEETTTKILFTSDSTQNQQTICDAIFSVARRFKGELIWLRNAANAGITQALVDDLKKRVYRDLTILEKSGEFWSTSAKTANDINAEMTFVFAEPKVPGLMGGGMAACVSKFKNPMIFFNHQTKWVEPRNILMLLDSNSESRQKFYRVSVLAKMFGCRVHVLSLSSAKDNETVKYLYAYSGQGFNYMIQKGIPSTELDPKEGVEMVSTVLDELGKIRDCWVSSMNETDGGGFMKAGPFQQYCAQFQVPLMACAVQEIVGSGGSGY
jgi:hypothetical protein